LRLGHEAQGKDSASDPARDIADDSFSRKEPGYDPFSGKKITPQDRELEIERQKDLSSVDMPGELNAVRRRVGLASDIVRVMNENDPSFRWNIGR